MTTHDYSETSNARRIPVELANARESRTQAWNEYFLVIEREHTYDEYHQALNKAGAADDLCSDLYRRWQSVGGTSDIESIEAAELEAERHKALQIVLDVASARTPQLDPALQRLNRTAGYDIVSAICTTSPERKAWEKSYLEKRAAHVAKYWTGKTK